LVSPFDVNGEPTKNSIFRIGILKRT